MKAGDTGYVFYCKHRLHLSVRNYRRSLETFQGGLIEVSMAYAGLLKLRNILALKNRLNGVQSGQKPRH